MIVVKSSGIHRQGVFATKDIPKDTKIIEYVGEKITNAEADKRAVRDDESGTVYLFQIDDEYTIDGDVPDNDAKFINHSCEPNCESEFDEDHIWVVASRDIKAGEELSFDYGFDYDIAQNHPCNCGAKKCRGFIVAENQYEKFKKHLQESIQKMLNKFTSS